MDHLITVFCLPFEFLVLLFFQMDTEFTICVFSNV